MCRTFEGEKGFDSSHSSFFTSTVGLRLAEKWLSEKIKLTMCHNEGLHARIMFCKKYFDKKPSGYYGKKNQRKFSGMRCIDVKCQISSVFVFIPRLTSKSIIMFITFWWLRKFLFHHKWNEGWLLALNRYIPVYLWRSQTV